MRRAASPADAATSDSGASPSRPGAAAFAPAGGATSSAPSDRASTGDSSARPPSADSPGPTASTSRAARLVLLPIRLYQRFVSPALPRRCKYHPTCSQYAVQAIQGYGILRGAVLAGWRLLRCNPWSHGGYDPVSAQTLFRRAPRSPGSSASDS